MRRMKKKSYGNTANKARALRVNVNGVDISATPPTLDIAAGTVLGDEAVSYQSGWNEFCGACHQDFKQTGAGSGDDTALGIYGSFARHRVGMDPSLYAGTNENSWTIATLSQPSPSSDGTAANQQVMCLTCHYAHGTKATNTVTFNRADGTSTSTSSTLLRLDNRGVCQVCHNI